MLSSTTVTKPILNSTKILYTDTDTIYYYIILLICYSSVYCILYAYGVHMTAESSGHVVTLSYVSKLPPFQDARKKPAGKKGECFCGTCSKSSKDWKGKLIASKGTTNQLKTEKKQETETETMTKTK